MSYAEEPEFVDWVRAVRTELIPKLEESSMVVSLLPSSGEADVKWAVELGFSIMMDKPIIVVVSPGSRVPPKLALIADHIVEGDMTTERGRARLHEALNAVAGGDAS